MKVVFHDDFKRSYTLDPAAAAGRMEAILDVIKDRVEFVTAVPADEEDIAAVHTKYHIDNVRRMGIYDIAALAAGGAIQAATIGLEEPCFGLIRPPGHHASANSCWGFCYFNNMAIALEKLRREGKIKKAFILDFDLHFGDGTVNILGGLGYATIFNPSSSNRGEFLKQVAKNLPTEGVDIIGVSAGFDYAKEDWGGVLERSDYTEMGQMVREAARKCIAGCFGILEGGYNHKVLGHNCMAFLEGLGG
ncbi:MAG TPA: histone deacetylase family protein [Syntrophales bacterium]|nr:histone deacetylase family protein [Syntrophobacterales bacterium]HRR41686.1 histone deacetylase family protein [Syntrophales bacterium]HRT71337.1 histone deacetylase family protein [Syntrophales bacterium]